MKRMYHYHPSWSKWSDLKQARQRTTAPLKYTLQRLLFQHLVKDSQILKSELRLSGMVMQGCRIDTNGGSTDPIHLFSSYILLGVRCQLHENLVVNIVILSIVQGSYSSYMPIFAHRKNNSEYYSRIHSHYSLWWICNLSYLQSKVLGIYLFILIRYCILLLLRTSHHLHDDYSSAVHE